MLTCRDVIDTKALTTRLVFLEVLEEFHLINKVKFVVTDNCNTMRAAFDHTNNYIINNVLEVNYSDDEYDSDEEEDGYLSNSEDDHYVDLDSNRTIRWSGCAAHQVINYFYN